jgi:hypothetical protein
MKEEPSATEREITQFIQTKWNGFTKVQQLSYAR